MRRVAPFVWTTIVVALALTCAFGVPPQDNPQFARHGAAAWRLAAPVTFKNLTIFPVVSNQPASAETSHFVTLDEALKSGDVVVKERDSATVNNLVLINRGSRPLLLLAGEL